jgi:hypothetical protein
MNNIVVAVGKVTMKKKSLKFSVICLAFISSSLISISFAGVNNVQIEESLVFESGSERVTLLEMYSSQGCSSCPPAEKWLNKFIADPSLWKRFIPVVFHVDYWDYLGWKDPYSDHAYSARQREFKRQGLIHSVYTPGFTLNGKEWRGWFTGKVLPVSQQQTGNLKLNMRGSRINATYSQFTPEQRLNIALVGFNLNTYVANGENHQRTLSQEFVVLDFWQVNPDDGEWTTEWQRPKPYTKSIGIVAWITEGKSLLPLQTTGGRLPFKSK